MNRKTQSKRRRGVQEKGTNRKTQNIRKERVQEKK